MDAFAPEFSRHWLGEHVDEDTVAGNGAADEASDRAALDALADRVSAARLVT